MLIQKAYRNGNSIAATLPKEYVRELGIRNGSEIVVAKERGKITITPRKSSGLAKSGEASHLTPEFKQWLDDVVRDEEKLIRELAKR